MNEQKGRWKRGVAPWLALALVASVWACSQTPRPQTSQTPLQGPPSHQAPSGRLRFHAPPQWISESPSSSMRVAQYKLPAADRETDDASLIIYYFGPGQGGSVEANLARWINQMEQPDGGSSEEKATTKTTTVNGLKVTLLDVSGTYRAEVMPGSGMRHNTTNARLRAAVVETSKGPYFVKLVGPEKTVHRWEEAFTRFIDSFEFK